MKKHKHKYKSDSNEVDSSWRGGSGSIWGCNCRKPMFISDIELDKNTTPCPSKATDTSILNVTSNLMNTDANCNQILKSLTANNKNSDLFNNINSD